MVLREDIGSGFSVCAMNSTGPRPEHYGSTESEGDREDRGAEVKLAVKTWVRSVR